MIRLLAAIIGLALAAAPAAAIERGLSTEFAEDLTVSDQVSIGTTPFVNNQALTVERNGTGGILVRNSAAASTTGGAGIIGRHVASPSAGHRLGFFALGADLFTTIGIFGWATETWTGSTRSSYLTIEGTPTGSTTRAEKFRFTGDGTFTATLQPSFRASSTGTQAIPDNTYTEVIITTAEDHDHQSMFAISAGTVPVGGAGGYNISGMVRFAAAATGTRLAAIYKNGTLIPACTDDAAGSATGDTIFFVPCGTVSLADGDVIKLMAFQNSGGSVNVNTAYLSMAKVW